MPTYDYLCSHCGHRFEQFQSMKDAPLKKCPQCGRRALKRLLGAGAGLIFKGSGFYITDYKKNPGGSDGSKAGGGSKSSSGDASPAPKPASTSSSDKK